METDRSSDAPIVTTPEFVSMVAGSLASQSPICVEDAIAAAFHLLCEFADAGWHVSRVKSLGEVWAEVDPSSPHFSPEDRMAAERASDHVEEPEHDDEPVSTRNDFMVASGSMADHVSIIKPPAPYVEFPNDEALRLAAWLSVIGDPTGREFDRVRAAVMNT